MKLSFRQNKIRLLPILFLLGISTFFTSCYTDYGLSTSDYDIVITQYNKTTDFSNYKKFAIVDSVFHLTGDSTEPDSEYLTRQYDEFIINTIIDNMKNLGYEYIASPQDSSEVDVILFVAAQGSKVDQYYYGGWWGGYYPGWGYYPPYWGYPGYIGSTTYYVGTLFINYVDISNMNNPTVDVEWNAILNGLLSDDAYTVTQNRLADKINTAFNQSPYLSVK